MTLALRSLIMVLTCALVVSGGPAAAELTLPGRILFAKEGNLWLLKDGQVVQLTAGETWAQPDWAPDGQHLAFVVKMENFSEIFSMTITGEEMTQLTYSQSTYVSDNDWQLRPRWSPDGTTVAYLSDRNSINPMLWLMNADGSEKREVLAATSADESVAGMSWAPDGKRLAVAAFRGGTSQIYVLTLEDGSLEPITSHEGGALDPCWSPDGTLIAYTGRERGHSDIYVATADGSFRTQVGNSGRARQPAWSPDGNLLAFLSAETGTFDIWVAPVLRSPQGIALGEPERVTHDLGLDADSGLSWAP